jgi:molybdopterin converting factor subunit 1
MIDVGMKFFGPVRDIVKKDELNIQVPAPHNGEAAYEVLVAMYPELRRWKQSIRLAVNLEYVPFDHPLRPGDEVSFIPPVSGG